MFTEQAIAKLQSPGAELLDEASLYIVDLPGPEAIVDGVDVQAHAMIEAAPDGPNGRGGFRIYLYMLNILRQTSGLEDVQSAIQNALEGELNQLVKELESLSMPSPDAEEA